MKFTKSRILESAWTNLPVEIKVLTNFSFLPSELFHNVFAIVYLFSLFISTAYTVSDWPFKLYHQGEEISSSFPSLHYRRQYRHSHLSVLQTSPKSRHLEMDPYANWDIISKLPGMFGSNFGGCPWSLCTKHIPPRSKALYLPSQDTSGTTAFFLMQYSL